MLTGIIGKHFQYRNIKNQLHLSVSLHSRKPDAAVLRHLELFMERMLSGMGSVHKNLILRDLDHQLLSMGVG